MEKKIFYKKESYFIILPKLTIDDLVEFKIFTRMVKQTYNTKNEDCFFWLFDEFKNCILINDDTNIVENDIYSQLVTLVYWLFQKNYQVKGSFVCKIDNLTEVISINGIDNSVVHYTIMKDIQIDNCLSESYIPYIVNHEESIKECKRIFTDIQDRLSSVENKVKKIENMNQILWKICGIIGFFTAGSFFLLTLGANDGIPLGLL